MMRAAKRGQGPSTLEQLQRAQMNFFVAAQRIWNRGTVARELRRIKDDDVKFGNEFFIRTNGRLCFEPIEHVR